MVFVRLKSPHTGDTIKQLTEDVLNRYDIKEKVFKIIADNASSMIKAYKFGLLGDEASDKYYDTNNAMSNGVQTIEDKDDGKWHLFLSDIIRETIQNKDIRSRPLYK